MKSLLAFRRDDTIPEWCGLPVPGISLSISTEDIRKLGKYPVDTKRMYTVEGEGVCDILIPAMGKTRISLYHHRNGSLYISSKSSSVNIVGEGSTAPVSDIPSEFRDRFSVHAGDVWISNMSIREALRHADTEDDTTRMNTARNQKRSAVASPFPKLVPQTPVSRTPVSQRRRRKRLKKAPSGNTVKFLDFEDA